MSEYKAILLAAGSGSRFDPLGIRNKLLQPLPDGCAVAVGTYEASVAQSPESNMGGDGFGDDFGSRNASGLRSEAYASERPK